VLFYLSASFLSSTSSRHFPSASCAALFAPRPAPRFPQRISSFTSTGSPRSRQNAAVITSTQRPRESCMPSAATHLPAPPAHGQRQLQSKYARTRHFIAAYILGPAEPPGACLPPGLQHRVRAPAGMSRLHCQPRARTPSPPRRAKTKPAATATPSLPRRVSEVHVLESPVRQDVQLRIHRDAIFFLPGQMLVKASSTIGRYVSPTAVRFAHGPAPNRHTRDPPRLCKATSLCLWRTLHTHRAARTPAPSRGYGNFSANSPSTNLLLSIC